MLSELHIRNLGVIEEVTAEFAGGFTVLTGETGAGKTMVLSSLRLLSGHRADASRVRAGSDKATVEGIFDVSTLGADEDVQAVRAMIDEIDGFADDGEVIATRTVSSAGRSRAHLAGKTVAAGMLSQFSSAVLTIHGQNDQLRLLDPARQLEVLDEFAGHHELLGEYREARQRWLLASKDLERRLKDRRELALESETLQRAIGIIDDIDPQPNEDEDVKAQIRRMQDADDMRRNLQQALAMVDGSEAEDPEMGNAQDFLAQAASLLAGEDEELQGLADRLNEVSALLTDIAHDAGRALLHVPDPESLESLLERQQSLRELRKFAVDVNGALEWRSKAQERLATIDVSDDVIEALQEQVAAAEKDMLALAQRLSKGRQAAAAEFGKAVTAEIARLHMSSTVTVSVQQQDPGASGIDAVEFRLTQGGHETALASSASGGELSRIMLALEVILAQRTASTGRTMVFDEVDAGVGGKAAVEIGQRLAMLAEDNQVIVVTHLPQVAAFADTHLYVAKQATDSSVSSTVRALSDEERVEELSRMLAGLESETGRAHAEELMEMARARRGIS
ncbi:DNA repair protein RecN [Corynebacterium sp. 320]|uniref:DNA repair protein RecN n=1 Tax=Corynebacterium TaxID=1716 RepID=UPI00125CCA69|nr:MULTISPECIES: DNA repair protein RecN [Corynebacterium]KAB1503575.1 DNA repair protein RecN [Corynebacterium sp. 320]KAB1553324.1 DNA repair protein RecN [Corynebacterium sp. 321]KAB1553458.1 DNA repair protein RecN [Corynebacterium sp. 319]KAB3527711.1 DNA repair protein RecN [Corynebacterium sp. 250]KAB3540798.1 DNA repair protein RecN [Corynebacterium sp. 366]